MLAEAFRVQENEGLGRRELKRDDLVAVKVDGKMESLVESGREDNVLPNLKLSAIFSVVVVVVVVIKVRGVEIALFVGDCFETEILD